MQPEKRDQNIDSYMNRNESLRPLSKLNTISFDDLVHVYDMKENYRSENRIRVGSNGPEEEVLGALEHKGKVSAHRKHSLRHC